MIDSWDCCHHCLLVEGVRRHLSLVAKTQYRALLVSRGGWYKVTVSFLPPLKPSPVSWSIKWRRRGVKVRELALMSCVMRPVNSCRTCNDAHNIRFPRYISCRYDSIRYDNRPFSKRNTRNLQASAAADIAGSWLYNHYSSAWYIYDTRAHISLPGYSLTNGYPDARAPVDRPTKDPQNLKCVATLPCGMSVS